MWAGSIDPERVFGQRVFGSEEIGQDVLLGEVEVWVGGSDDHVGF